MVDDLVGREPEDRPGPLRDPEDPRRVVEDPQPRFGGVCRQAQALLALPQGFVGVLSSQRIGEDLRDQLQPLHQRIRPVALRPRVLKPMAPMFDVAPHRAAER